MQSWSKRRAADRARAAVGFSQVQFPSVTESAQGAVAVAQVNALSNPETAIALQKLHNLLFTRVLTDAEFAAAKEKLLGPVDFDDPYDQLEKLADLHADGILGDLDFAAAKARVLGL